MSYPNKQFKDQSYKEMCGYSIASQSFKQQNGEICIEGKVCRQPPKERTADEIALKLATQIEEDFEEFDLELERQIFADPLGADEQVEFTREEIDQRIQEEGGFNDIFQDYAMKGSREAKKGRDKGKVAARRETYPPLLEMRHNDRGIHVDRAHAAKIRQNLMKLAKSRQLCDVVIFNGPNVVQGVAMHSIILRAESDLWNYDVEKKAELRCPDEQIEIRLRSAVDQTCFKFILRYMYTGKLDIGINDVLNMQRAALALQVPEVVTLCNDFLQLLFSGQNLITLMSALKMEPGGDTCELMELCRQRITQKMDGNGGGKFKENALISSDLKDLSNVFDEMGDDHSEMEKLIMALNWLNFDRVNRIGQLKELLELIDFTKMTESELVSVWEIDEIFRQHPIAKDTLMKANLARALSAVELGEDNKVKLENSNVDGLETGTEWVYPGESQSIKQLNINQK